jgi:hypothetical protein
MKVWQPYEALGPDRQESLMEAAACALDLIRHGRVTAHGTLGHLLTVQPHRDVYEGDRPSPSAEARAVIRETLRRSWEQARQEAEDWLQSARTDPGAARQILGTLARHSKTQDDFDRERRFMISCGIPASFLPEWRPERGPEANELGKLRLT